jgi:hypothetical protein
MKLPSRIRTTQISKFTRCVASVSLGLAAMTGTNVWAQALDVATTAQSQVLWIQGERVAFGVGSLSTARGPSSIALNAMGASGATIHDGTAQRTYALGFNVTPSTMLSWESPASSFKSHQHWVQSQDHRLGLTFKSQSASKDFKSLMTVQLSGTSVLNFRPRAGGMRVTYAMNF